MILGYLIELNLISVVMEIYIYMWDLYEAEVCFLMTRLKKLQKCLSLVKLVRFSEPVHLPMNPSEKALIKVE